jgi:hypothetical protein
MQSRCRVDLLDPSRLELPLLQLSADVRGGPRPMNRPYRDSEAILAPTVEAAGGFKYFSLSGPHDFVYMAA